MFNNRAPVDFADLDLDDTTAFGPERVTLRRSPSAGGTFVPGDYHYWVHNFSRSTYGLLGQCPGAGPKDPPTASDATVTVLVDGVQLGRFLVSAATGNQDDDIWHVVNLQISSNGAAIATVIQTLLTGDETTTP